MNPEVSLNTPRQTPPLTAPKQRGLPSGLRPIELNLPNDFNRCKDESGAHYWTYFSRKQSSLYARIQPDLGNHLVRISVFEQDRANRQDATKGIRIRRWSTELRMNGDWKMHLAECAGRAMKQVDKQPRCLCGEFMILRTRKSDHRQFFGCSSYPKCTFTASIGIYEVIVNKSFTGTPQTTGPPSSKERSNGHSNNGNRNGEASG